MLEAGLSEELEEERREACEFIKLFKAMPKRQRRDIKNIMVGMNLILSSQKQEEQKV